MYVIKIIINVILLKTFVNTLSLRDLWGIKENSRFKAPINRSPARKFFVQRLDFPVNQRSSNFIKTHEQPAPHFSSVYNRFDEIKKLIRPHKTENAKFIAEINEVLPKVIDIGKIHANIVTPVKENENKQHESMFEKYFKQVDSKELITTYDREPDDDDDDDSFENNNDGYWEPNARRIFRGHRASIKDFPFMASILVFGKFHCAGSIIDDDLVLTAASCLQLVYNNRFFRENPKFLSVRVGSSFTIGGGETIDVMEVYFHPGYNPRSLWHNMAIMRLERMLYIKRKKRRVRKIRLDTSATPFSGGLVTVVGWGAVSAANVLQHPFRNVLRYDTLYPYDNHDCKDIYSRAYVTERNFCAGFMSKGGGACNHDVGGPGIVHGRLVGVISFGSPNCGQRDAPTVFMKVGYYYSWIEKIRSQPVPTGYKRTTLWTPLTYHTRTTQRITTFQIQPIDDSEKNRAITVMTANTIQPPIPTTTVKKETREIPKMLSRQEILELAAHDTVFYKLLIRKLREKYKKNSKFFRGHGNTPDFSDEQNSNQADSNVYDDDDNHINSDKESLLGVKETSTVTIIKQQPRTTTPISLLSDVNNSDETNEEIKLKNSPTETNQYNDEITEIYDSDEENEKKRKSLRKSVAIDGKKVKNHKGFGTLIANISPFILVANSRKMKDDQINDLIEKKYISEKLTNILMQAIADIGKKKSNRKIGRALEKFSKPNKHVYRTDAESDYIRKIYGKEQQNKNEYDFDIDRGVMSTTKTSLFTPVNLKKIINNNKPKNGDKNIHKSRKAISPIDKGSIEYYEDTDTFTKSVLSDKQKRRTTKSRRIKTTTTIEPTSYTFGIFSDIEETRKSNNKYKPNDRYYTNDKNKDSKYPNKNKPVYKSDTKNVDTRKIYRKELPNNNKYDFNSSSVVMPTTKTSLRATINLEKRIDDDKHNNIPRNGNKNSHKSRKALIDVGNIEYYEDTDTFTKSLLSNKQKRRSTKTRRIQTTMTNEPTSYTFAIFSDVEETRKSNKKYKPHVRHNKHNESKDFKYTNEYINGYKTDTKIGDIRKIYKEEQPSNNKYDFHINRGMIPTTETSLFTPISLDKRIDDDKHNNKSKNGIQSSHKSRKAISPVDEGIIEYYDDTDTFTKSLLNDKQKRRTTKTRKIKTTTTMEPTLYTFAIFSDVEETRKNNKKHKPNNKYYTTDENNDSTSITDSSKDEKNHKVKKFNNEIRYTRTEHIGKNTKHFIKDEKSDVKSTSDSSEPNSNASDRNENNDKKDDKTEDLNHKQMHKLPVTPARSSVDTNYEDTDTNELLSTKKQKNTNKKNRIKLTTTSDTISSDSEEKRQLSKNIQTNNEDDKSEDVNHKQMHKFPVAPVGSSVDSNYEETDTNELSPTKKQKNTKNYKVKKSNNEIRYTRTEHIGKNTKYVIKDEKSNLKSTIDSSELNPNFSDKNENNDKKDVKSEDVNHKQMHKLPVAPAGSSVDTDYEDTDTNELSSMKKQKNTNKKNKMKMTTTSDIISSDSEEKRQLSKNIQTNNEYYVNEENSEINSIKLKASDSNTVDEDDYKAKEVIVMHKLKKPVISATSFEFFNDNKLSLSKKPKEFNKKIKSNKILHAVFSENKYKDQSYSKFYTYHKNTKLKPTTPIVADSKTNDDKKNELHNYNKEKKEFISKSEENSVEYFYENKSSFYKKIIKSEKNQIQAQEAEKNNKDQSYPDLDMQNENSEMKLTSESKLNDYEEDKIKDNNKKHIDKKKLSPSEENSLEYYVENKYIYKKSSTNNKTKKNKINTIKTTAMVSDYEKKRNNEDQSGTDYEDDEIIEVKPTSSKVSYKEKKNKKIKTKKALTTNTISDDNKRNKKNTKTNHPNIKYNKDNKYRAMKLSTSQTSNKKLNDDNEKDETKDTETYRLKKTVGPDEEDSVEYNYENTDTDNKSLLNNKSNKIHKKTKFISTTTTGAVFNDEESKKKIITPMDSESKQNDDEKNSRKNLNRKHKLNRLVSLGKENSIEYYLDDTENDNKSSIRNNPKLNYQKTIITTTDVISNDNNETRRSKNKNKANIRRDKDVQNNEIKLTTPKASKSKVNNDKQDEITEINKRHKLKKVGPGNGDSVEYYNEDTDTDNKTITVTTTTIDAMFSDNKGAIKTKNKTQVNTLHASVDKNREIKLTTPKDLDSKDDKQDEIKKVNERHKLKKPYVAPGKKDSVEYDYEDMDSDHKKFTIKSDLTDHNKNQTNTRHKDDKNSERKLTTLNASDSKVKQDGSKEPLKRRKLKKSLASGKDASVEYLYEDNENKTKTKTTTTTDAMFSDNKGTKKSKSKTQANTPHDNDDKNGELIVNTPKASGSEVTNDKKYGSKKPKKRPKWKKSLAPGKDASVEYFYEDNDNKTITSTTSTSADAKFSDNKVTKKSKKDTQKNTPHDKDDKNSEIIVNTLKASDSKVDNDIEDDSKEAKERRKLKKSVVPGNNASVEYYNEDTDNDNKKITSTTTTTDVIFSDDKGLRKRYNKSQANTQYDGDDKNREIKLTTPIANDKQDESKEAKKRRKLKKSLAPGKDASVEYYYEDNDNKTITPTTTTDAMFSYNKGTKKSKSQTQDNTPPDKDDKNSEMIVNTPKASDSKVDNDKDDDTKDAKKRRKLKKSLAPDKENSTEYYYEDDNNKTITSMTTTTDAMFSDNKGTKKSNHKTQGHTLHNKDDKNSELKLTTPKASDNKITVDEEDKVKKKYKKHKLKKSVSSAKEGSVEYYYEDSDSYNKSLSNNKQNLVNTITRGIYIMTTTEYVAVKPTTNSAVVKITDSDSKINEHKVADKANEYKQTLHLHNSTTPVNANISENNEENDIKPLSSDKQNKRKKIKKIET